MKQLYIIPFIILMVGFCDEKTENLPNDISHISYGTSFGECIGYCQHEIKISEEEIVSVRKGWDLQELLPELKIEEQILPDYWNLFAELVDFSKFSKLDSVLGCPDCADGGAEWIEIKHEGESKKVVFEYRNEPDEVKEYIGYLRAYLHVFELDTNQSLNFETRVLVNQPGFMKRFVNSRGLYQWLVASVSDEDTSFYFDPYLELNYRVDDLQVRFTGVLEFDSTMIYKPAPNDAFLPDFKTRNMRIFSISEE